MLELHLLKVIRYKILLLLQDHFETNKTVIVVCLSVCLSVCRFFLLVFINGRYADALPPSDVLASQTNRRDVAELFDVLVTQPLRSVQRPEPLSPEKIQPPVSASRRLIVVDALDECDRRDRDELFRLIDKFDATSPDWLYLLITVRDDDDDRELLSRLNGAQKVELKADLADSETVADVRRYLREAMARRIDRISLDGALAQLAKNAQANFLCATFLKVLRVIGHSYTALLWDEPIAEALRYGP